MLYQIVKPFARWILGWNFRRIYLSGLERLPKSGPIILACNHPTAFIEPCIVAAFQKRPLFFLVRGDFFKIKIFGFLLRKLHMIPVYRLKDGGFSKLKKNYSSFDTCSKALAEGKALMILAEGTSFHEKKLRPIRKGTARIAFGTVENYAINELKIFPIGVNYTNSDAYRSDLMLDVGKPIALSKFIAPYEMDKAEGIKLLTNSIHAAMSKNVIHIEDSEDEKMAEQIWQLWRNDRIDPHQAVYQKSNERLVQEKKVADRINQLAPRTKQHIGLMLTEYFSNLERQGIDDLAISDQSTAKKFIGPLVLFFPFFIIGVVLNFTPLLVAHALGMFKNMSVEFRHAVRISSAIVTYSLWMLLLILIVGKINAWIIPIICILVPFLCWTSIRYIEYYVAYRKLNSASRKPREVLSSIEGKRKKLIERLLEDNLWA